MKEKKERIEELERCIKDRKIAYEIYLMFLRWEEENRTIMRERQMNGIRKAKEEGKALGRPRLREPKDFQEIAVEWSKKKISAAEGARLCNMGVSTFYRRMRDWKDHILMMEKRDDYEIK